MSTKRIVVVVVILALGLGTLPAQTAIDQLATDLQTVLVELGEDMVPNLQTAAILNHGLGSAELGNFPHMYVSMSAGATVAPGVLEFTRDEDKFENFGLIDQLLDDAGLNDADVRDITDNYAPYPSLRLGYGVGLMGGYEVSLQAGIAPQAIADLAGQDGLTASITTIGTRVRKVLVRRDRGVPAISAGLGYVYSSIHFAYDLADVDPLEVSGTTTLDVDGEASFKVNTHSFGFDVRASTKVLGFSYPFIGMTTYYQVSNFEAGVDGFSGVLTVSGTPSNVTSNVQPFTDKDYRNFNVVLNTGFDMKFTIFNLFAHLNYAVSTRAPGAILGMRVQL